MSMGATEYLVLEHGALWGGGGWRGVGLEKCERNGSKSNSKTQVEDTVSVQQFVDLPPVHERKIREL